VGVRVRNLISLPTILLLMITVGAFTFATAQQTKDGNDLRPTGKGWGEVDHASNAAKPSGGSRTTCTNGICYHGGAVMAGTPTIYYIWYGNWSGGAKASDSGTSISILDNFINSLGGSSYEHINSSYSISGSTITDALSHSNSADVYDNYSQGTSFGDAGVQAIVSAKINSGALPKNSNAVYFVLTSSDVNETSGFCTQYCGWHTHANIAGSDIKYAFVGNPDRCPSACEEETNSPNSDSGADGMASIIAHEQEEAISDPDLNAWYDRQGAENADKCAWTFGTTSTASNGSLYNITLGGSKYLIQRNWLNASGGLCTMSY
jgi:hypothetical protein